MAGLSIRKSSRTRILNGGRMDISGGCIQPDSEYSGGVGGSRWGDVLPVRIHGCGGCTSAGCRTASIVLASTSPYSTFSAAHSRGRHRQRRRLRLATQRSCQPTQSVYYILLIHISFAFNFLINII